MLDFNQYTASRHCTLLKSFCAKEHSHVALLRPVVGGDFICRAYDHPVPAYEQLVGVKVPQLPTVYRCISSEDGSTIVDEEFVDGITLSELLKTIRPDQRQTASIVLEVCRALIALHKKGIIHRDVKPENVLLTSGGRVVLLDLDASSQYDPEKCRDTSLLGTVGYAAPEQFGFGRSDVRTDIFGLGVMMNIMLTGQHPSQRLATGALRPVIERCIAVNADQRYPSVSELIDALLPIEETPLRCPVCGFTTPGSGCLYCGLSSVSAVPPARKKTWPKVIVAAVLCLSIGGVIGFLSGAAPSADVPANPQPSEIQTSSPNVPANPPAVEVPPAALPPAESNPTETKPVQSEVAVRDSGFALVPASFLYNGETYTLNAGFDFGGYLRAISQERLGLREKNSPDDEYDLPAQSDRLVAPVIWRQTADGEPEPATDLAHLMENASVTLYRWKDTGDPPDIIPMDPYQGLWGPCIDFRFHYYSTGWWLVEVKATIEGVEYTSHSLIVITNEWP